MRVRPFVLAAAVLSWAIGVVSTAAPSSTATEPGSRQTWWSYLAPVKASIPSVMNTDWARTPVDPFILAALEAEQLGPAADAAPATLLRRLYYDLIGLPPTPGELARFLSDPSPAAYQREVEALLARPQFGERWGRHWLDVVRFAESVTLRGLVFTEAWRYRDYVIDAFNRDLPFDQFIQEQVAGDLLPAGTLEERRRKLVATAFLCLGNTNLEEQDKLQLRMDVVDEQLDTLGKAFLAQTIGCARCHDHKFDPIPTRDYYAMAGILRNVETLIEANVSGWIETPLPVEPELEQQLSAQESAERALEEELKAAKAVLAKAGAGNSSASVVDPKALPGVVLDDSQAKRVGEWQHSRHSGRFIGDGYLHDQNSGKGKKTLTFQPELPEPGHYEIRLAYNSGGSRATAVPVTVFSADGDATILVNQRKPPPIDDRFVSLGRHRFEKNGQGFVLISNEGTDGHVIVDAVQFIRAGVLDTAGPTLASGVPAAADPDSSAAAKNVQRLESELQQLRSASLKRPKTMTVREVSDITAAIPIHIRGSVHRAGEPVPRGFLRAAGAGTEVVLPENQSGRLELGEWLAGDSNPLTARVFVNRAWHWLFGAGLVRTVDNFGTTGERPSHPELLDFLALDFVGHGWSVKHLVRRLVLSRAYQQSSDARPDGVAADPENRLLWRMNRRRLEAECLRDSILAVSGALKLEAGGSAIRPGTSSDFTFIDADTRRSIYVPSFRNALPDIFLLFDAADPSMVTGQRNASTVAPQALFLLNHPFVTDQARRAAERLLELPIAALPNRIQHACLLVLGRMPTDAELALFTRFLEDAPAEASAWGMVFQALFASLDFRYLH